MFESPIKVAERKRAEERQIAFAKSMDRSEVLAGREPHFEDEQRQRIEDSHARAAVEAETAEKVEARKQEILEEEMIEKRARDEIDSQRRQAVA